MVECLPSVYEASPLLPPPPLPPSGDGCYLFIYFPFIVDDYKVTFLNWACNKVNIASDETDKAQCNSCYSLNSWFYSWRNQAGVSPFPQKSTLLCSE